jgi:exopolysaccharide biosynthesis polyprenyl glycosylphosphotransferase
MKTFWRSPFLTLILLVLDAVFLAWIWQGIYEFRVAWGDLFARPINPREAYAGALPFLLVLWLLVLARFKFYSHHERIAGLNALGPIFWAVVWMMIFIAVYNIVLKPDFGRTVMGGFAAGAAVYLFVSRTVFRIVKRRAVQRGQGLVRALVVGAGDLARETLARIREHPDIGFRIVGFVPVGAAGDNQTEFEGYPVAGGVEDLLTIIRRNGVEEVFLACPDMSEDAVFELIRSIQGQARVVFKVAANMLYVIANRAKVDEIVGLPVIAFRGSELTPAQILVKRLVDLVVGGALGVLLAPLAFVFAILIRLDSKGPALFVHERVGLGEKRFRMIKFRTMFLDGNRYAEAPVDQSDCRVTRFGRFLRRTSLDEIPQILNVLRGDMSLVGPRPEMAFIVDSYKPWQRVRLSVKPGLTGLWQVAGRKNLPLHFNLEYDFYYVKNQALGLDAEILLRTIPAVLLGKGAY